MFANVVTKIDRNLHLMGQMQERLSVTRPANGGEMEALAWARAVRRCAFCRTSSTCAEWLASEQGTRGSAAGFCPNADFFSAQRLPTD